MLKKVFATSLLLALFATLTGCNTIQGAGKDIERGGEKIQKEAAEAKKN